MKKVIALAALAAIALVPTLVKANEKHETTTTTHQATTTTEHDVKHETLKDGTKISIEGKHVYVVSSDGTKTAAPDAEHELADGTKVKTHGGLIVE